ncbi:MAG: transglutaminase [Rhodospirillales bacterium]|nr:transglutaminase [Rhodospirillales bacterium]
MRILTVRHISTYRYSKPVGLGEHWMMFRPRASHDLRLISTTLDITPAPKEEIWLHDVFDNSVAVASFKGKTRELRFESTVTLEHFETPRPEYRLAPEAKTFPFEYDHDDRPNLELGLLRRYPSQRVDDWAKSFVSQNGKPQGTMALLRAIVLGTRKQLVYSRRVERGTQTPEETLMRGSGTCRDFALLMIEAVRSLGIAARFVSGYIFVPENVFSNTVGGGATHAWLQVYLPGAGWIDFDPTNNIIGNRNLIRVAVAWDPANALPLWGTFIGSAASFLGLEVTVNVADETPPKED